MNRRNDRTLTPFHPSGEGQPYSQGRALFTSIVKMGVFFKLHMLHIACVENYKCCKLQVLQNIASNNVSNFVSNIVSAKCNFKLGYPPTHQRTDRWTSWVAVAAKYLTDFLLWTICPPCLIKDSEIPAWWGLSVNQYIVLYCRMYKCHLLLWCSLVLAVWRSVQTLAVQQYSSTVVHQYQAGNPTTASSSTVRSGE